MNSDTELIILRCGDLDQKINKDMTKELNAVKYLLKATNVKEIMHWSTLW